MTENIDPNSATWQAVKGYCERRLSKLRNHLETDGLPHEQTERLRGGIREVKDLLKLADDKNSRTAQSTESVD